MGLSGNMPPGSGDGVRSCGHRNGGGVFSAEFPLFLFPLSLYVSLFCNYNILSSTDMQRFPESSFSFLTMKITKMQVNGITLAQSLGLKAKKA
jgi:hypothetical protein